MKSKISKNLKSIRSIHGFTQEQMAKKLKLKRVTYGAFEESRNEPNIKTLIKISNYFKISVDSLIKEVIFK